MSGPFVPVIVQAGSSVLAAWALAAAKSARVTTIAASVLIRFRSCGANWMNLLEHLRRGRAADLVFRGPRSAPGRTEAIPRRSEPLQAKTAGSDGRSCLLGRGADRRQRLLGGCG